MNRRGFIRNSIAASSLMEMRFNSEIDMRFNPAMKGKIKPIIMATNWGFKGTMDEFCAAAHKEGYDGIELWWNDDANHQKTLFDALEKYGLKVGYLTSSNSSDFDTHLLEFSKNLSNVTQENTVRPLYINCHSGKDYFSHDQNCKIIELVLERAEKTGIEIIHETHRSRMCYSAPNTFAYLKKYPNMALTLDISHWTNVHESLLDDQRENVKLALERTRHIHLRVGHQEGPQVNDPRAPEWTKTMQAHLHWWDEVVENRIQNGATEMTFLTEFGPPNYLPTLPYTRQPIADQWEINVYMMNLIRQRYS